MLRYFLTIRASSNHFEKEAGRDLSLVSDSALTFDFDGFDAFQEWGYCYPMDKEEVEGRIRAFGGNPSVWDGYALSVEEYNTFLKYFGIDYFYSSLGLIQGG